MTPILSIIIPSYNTKDILRDCLESIHRETHDTPYEIIVVDNDSEDGTRDMLREEFPRIRTILNDVNRRWSGANNQGVGISRGEFLLFLNSDTLIEPGALDAFVRYMRDNPGTGIAGCRLLNPDRTLQPSCRGFPTMANIFFESFFLCKLFPRSRIFGEYHMSYFSHEEERDVKSLMGAALMVRRNVMEKVGEFDESFDFYGEETDFCYRAAAEGVRVRFFPGAEIVHLGSASPQLMEVHFERIHRGQIHFLKKHHSGYRLYLMIFLKSAGVFLRVPVYFFTGILTGDGSLIRKSLYYLKVLF